jgi:hypothetical protein
LYSVPFGGFSSSQVLKSRSFSKGGMSTPWPPATSFSTDERVDRNIRRLFEPDKLIEMVGPGAWGLPRGLDTSRHRDPAAFLSADIFGAEQQLAVLFDQPGYQLVDRLEVIRLGGHVQIRHLQDVVARSGLRLGGGGQSELVTLAGNEVDGQIDFFPVGPLAAEFGERLIGAGNPVVPEANREVQNPSMAMAVDPAGVRGVTFNWKDYRAKGDARYKLMALDADEFIRRFLIHVLPDGFHRIRHYGLFANGGRAENLARARQLLNVPAPQNAPSDADSTGGGEPQAFSYPCPCCGGRMIIIEIFERGCAPRYRPTVPNRVDSS